MAYVVEKYCDYCERTTVHMNHQCNVCHARLERERIAVWNSLTSEEKLQDLRKRIEALERGPITY